MSLIKQIQALEDRVVRERERADRYQTLVYSICNIYDRACRPPGKITSTKVTVEEIEQKLILALARKTPDEVQRQETLGIQQAIEHISLLLRAVRELQKREGMEVTV